MSVAWRLPIFSVALTFVVFAPKILDADPLDAAVGKALFDRNWIPAPASTNAADGLGPLFTARSCATCHTRGGGARVVTREEGHEDILGAVVRFGRADGTTDPYYGLELQANAVPGLKPEGTVRFLPKLQYALYGPPLGEGVKAGARLAPTLFGRGAFNDVPDEEILKRAGQKGADGVVGRANRTPHGIGRYGWKAAQVTLEDQVSHAFAFDIGLSSPRQPLPYGDCTSEETECLSSPNGESPLFDGREISEKMVDVVSAYVRALRITSPAPPLADGEALFRQTGCASCHTPSLKVRDGSYISAYTDLLLHDMGTDLDDGVGEPGVKSSEWRTAPLIEGPLRSSPRRYLHDGSATSVAEAVGKHGGEGAHSRGLFDALTVQDKAALADYVNGL